MNKKVDLDEDQFVFNLPIGVSITNLSQNRFSNLEIYISMNRKSPSAQECDFKIKFKDVKSGQVLKFSYGESGKEFFIKH